MMNRISYLLLRGFVLTFGRLPLKVHYFFSGGLAFILEKVIRYRRDDVMVNLARCFPEKAYWDLPAIRHGFYRHLADVCVEAVWFGASSWKKAHDSRIVSIANPGEMQRLHDLAPGTVVLCSHSGNWELCGGTVRYNHSDSPWPETEKNVRVIYREVSNKAFDRLMAVNRKGALEHPDDFDGYIESRQALRFMMKEKGEKKIYHFITDQRPYYAGSGEVRVNFMGLDCPTMSGAAAIARKLGYAVAYERMTILSRGHYVKEYVTICENASGMEVQEIMQRYYRLLEDDIRKQPVNYLWTHRRWN